jgi:hypothetical protein
MKKPKSDAIIPSSFRDPSGFLFYRNGSLYRQVNTVYKENYDWLMNSGLYRTLVDEGLLVSHEEVDIDAAQPDTVYTTIKPEPISFISYPYEWCFSQLKHGALMTIEIQKKSLHFGMSLRDCSAYNVQFRYGKPIFIDTLSFERYCEGQPWVAYRQFCQHFLAPLALMSYRDMRLNQLFRIYIDGIPLDLASSLLPFRTRFTFSLLSHIHLHAKSQKYYARKTINKRGHSMRRSSLLGLIDNLESAIKALKWKPRSTEWADYYEDTNYSPDAFQHKKQIVAEFLDMVHPQSVWDFGSNIGIFSRIASARGIPTISFDIDPAAVEKNYRECLAHGEKNVLPLVFDLTNPSPGIGWVNRERAPLLERGRPDAVFALALIHHLVISNNVPLSRVAEFFSRICKTLIIEFVPKTDSQVQRLLSTKDDIFTDYTQPVFENELRKYFTILRSVKMNGSDRTLYLLER